MRGSSERDTLPDWFLDQVSASQKFSEQPPAPRWLLLTLVITVVVLVVLLTSWVGQSSPDDTSSAIVVFSLIGGLWFLRFL